MEESYFQFLPLELLSYIFSFIPRSQHLNSAFSHPHLYRVLNFLEGSKYHQLLTAYEKGYLEVVKWILKEYDLDRKDVSVNDNYIFRKTAENGHLEIMILLTDKLELTEEDARTADNYAFRYAAENGHLEVLKYLTD